MAFGVENGGGSGIPAGRPLPYLKHALPARQETVQSLHAFFEALRVVFCSSASD